MLKYRLPKFPTQILLYPRTSASNIKSLQESQQCSTEQIGSILQPVSISRYYWDSQILLAISSLDLILQWVHLFLFKNSFLWLKNLFYLKLLTLVSEKKQTQDSMCLRLSLWSYCCFANLLTSYSTNSLYPGEGKVFTKEINNHSLLLLSSPKGTEQLEIVPRETACIYVRSSSWWISSAVSQPVSHN